MRVPKSLADAFGAPFEELISRFASEKKLLPEPSAIQSTRFLSRSVIPHIQRLSQLFNRVEREDPELEEDFEPRKVRPKKKILPAQAQAGLDPYWKESSNPVNLRLAYFLYFMPSNLYRVASVWAELARLGFRWPGHLEDTRRLRAIEFGAGPASGACGIAAGEKFAPTGLPATGDWALIEQDRAMLDLGAEWAETYFANLGVGDWGTRRFHRKIDFKGNLLPPSAPRFNLWLMSYFLNESSDSPETLARTLLQTWERHLDEEGLVIMVEPALKLQSRKLLELRKAILAEKEKRNLDWIQLLLPCMGHQACGALAAEGDWCHEEVAWWRPPYFRVIDRLAGLDRKTLPFSYLIFVRSKRPIEEILPALAGYPAHQRQRLVSPAHSEGKDMEFFVCNSEGKRRARYRTERGSVQRGDILLGGDIRGDVHASRIENVRKINAGDEDQD